MNARGSLERKGEFDVLCKTAYGRMPVRYSQTQGEYKDNKENVQDGESLNLNGRVHPGDVNMPNFDNSNSRFSLERKPKYE